PSPPEPPWPPSPPSPPEPPWPPSPPAPMPPVPPPPPSSSSPQAAKANVARKVAKTIHTNRLFMNIPVVMPPRTHPIDTRVRLSGRLSQRAPGLSRGIGPAPLLCSARGHTWSETARSSAGATLGPQAGEITPPIGYGGRPWGPRR